jgi:hypothetical protein
VQPASDAKEGTEGRGKPWRAANERGDEDHGVDTRKQEIRDKERAKEVGEDP